MNEHLRASDPVPSMHAGETLLERFERFREGNDAVWGRGEWVECPLPSCVDGAGLPSFHHRRFHDAG